MSRNPKQMLSFGPLSKNSDSLPHYIANQEDFAGARLRVCNATMPTSDPLVLGERWAAPVRPGADDFRRHPSRGMG
jgi:hypothetical protein